jgi:hypothetical protein
VGRVWAAILLRRPRWRPDGELRRDYEATERADVLQAARRELGFGRESETPGLALDLAEVDARPAEATDTDSLLAVVGRDGSPAVPVSRVLVRLPAYSLIARRYVRAE